ncbi:MAG TPA: GNAT family N-acetyltransferase [Nocardioidaceae bacterium]|nr:GNAT family N-acetyltransferase [Nocardioidaceae bacterium]
MSRVDIRLVDAEAWAAWRQIRLTALADTPTAFGSTYESEIGFVESDWRSRLGQGGPAVLALGAGEPVGMGAGYQDLEGWLHLVAMWVDPRWRGHRVGSQILEELVGWAGQRGLRSHLDVTIGNPAAQRFYERFGFVGTGEARPLRPGSTRVVERMVLPQ